MEKNKQRCRRIRRVGGDIVGDESPLGGVGSLNVGTAGVVRPFCLVVSAFLVVSYRELLLHHLGCFHFNVDRISSFSGSFRESFHLPVFFFCIVVRLHTGWVVVVVVVDFSDLFSWWIVVVVVDIFDHFRPTFFIT